MDVNINNRNNLITNLHYYLLCTYTSYNTLLTLADAFHRANHNLVVLLVQRFIFYQVISRHTAFSLIHRSRFSEGGYAFPRLTCWRCRMDQLPIYKSYQYKLQLPTAQQV